MFGSQISLSGICAVASRLCTSLALPRGPCDKEGRSQQRIYTPHSQGFAQSLRDFAHPLRSRGVLATKKAEAKASVFAYKEGLKGKTLCLSIDVL